MPKLCKDCKFASNLEKASGEFAYCNYPKNLTLNRANGALARKIHHSLVLRMDSWLEAII